MSFLNNKNSKNTMKAGLQNEFSILHGNTKIVLVYEISFPNLRGNTDIVLVYAMSFANSARKHVHSTNLLSQTRVFVTKSLFLGI